MIQEMKTISSMKNDFYSGRSEYRMIRKNEWSPIYGTGTTIEVFERHCEKVAKEMTNGKSR